MNRYLLLVVVSLIFTQDSLKNDVREFSFTLKGMKVGIDFDDTFLTEEGGSIGLRHTPLVGVEFNTNYSIIVGVEHMFRSKLFVDHSVGSLSHTSFYGLYNLFKENKIVLNGKIGFSTFDLNLSGIDIDSSGGLMYGFQLELNDYFHISYTIHNGKYKYDSDSYYSSESYNTKSSRLNIAYKFKFKDKA